MLVVAADCEELDQGLRSTLKSMYRDVVGPQCAQKAASVQICKGCSSLFSIPLSVIRAFFKCHTHVHYTAVDETYIYFCAQMSFFQLRPMTSIQILELLCYIPCWIHLLTFLRMNRIWEIWERTKSIVKCKWGYSSSAISRRAQCWTVTLCTV